MKKPTLIITEDVRTVTLHPSDKWEKKVFELMSDAERAVITVNKDIYTRELESISFTLDDSVGSEKV